MMGCFSINSCWCLRRALVRERKEMLPGSGQGSGPGTRNKTCLTASEPGPCESGCPPWSPGVSHAGRAEPSTAPLRTHPPPPQRRGSGAFRLGLWGSCCLLLDAASWDHQAQAQLCVLSMTKRSSDWTSGPDLRYHSSHLCARSWSLPPGNLDTTQREIPP